MVWKELADIQQSALDTALAAKVKRKPKQAAAAQSAAHSNAAATSQGHSGGLEHADTNGHLASEENLAANRQAPAPVAQTSSFSKSQVCS